jgi:serine/threonine protein kinase
VKILDKRHIIKEKKVQYVSREKEVLAKINHPFFVKLFFTFQDKENLCILQLTPILGNSLEGENFHEFCGLRATCEGFLHEI